MAHPDFSIMSRKSVSENLCSHGDCLFRVFLTAVGITQFVSRYSFLVSNRTKTQSKKFLFLAFQNIFIKIFSKRIYKKLGALNDFWPCKSLIPESGNTGLLLEIFEQPFSHHIFGWTGLNRNLDGEASHLHCSLTNCSSEKRNGHSGNQ